MKNPPILTLLLCLYAAITVQGADMQRLEGHVPAGVRELEPVGQLGASNELKLAIGLSLRNREALTNLLGRLYDPASPDFHHFLTADQFAEQFGPTEQDYQAVMAFAKAHGLKVAGTHSNRTLLDVSGRIEDIEKTLHVTMRTYKHPRENRTFYAPDAEPSLELATPVLHIAGLDNYIVPRPMILRTAPKVGSLTGTRLANGTGPDGTYMGSDFRAAYVPGVVLTGAGQSVGLFELDGFFPSDVANYVSHASLPTIPLKTILLDGFDGTPGGGNIEVSLDITMAMSMAPGLDSVLVYEGEVPDDVLNRMATDRLARQLSASWLYGIDPSTEQIFQEFAAQGQSFFNSSGDSDAWANGVVTPGDDPNVTIVGGTTLTTTTAGGAWSSETVWNWDVEYGSNYDGIGSSGGISTSYPIPAWQQGISMTTNNGSTTMRNVPDVAMIADNVLVFDDDGSTDTVGGTSVATPLWAAFVALANEQAAQNGQAPLGFINPAVYAIGRGAGYGACFHDITTGNNEWSQSPNLFSAASGYDLCTGWGTPIGSNLVNALAPPDALQLSPPGNFAMAGGVGGPFGGGPGNYLLTNESPYTVSWSAGSSAAWLSITPSMGYLTPLSGVDVTVGLNAAAGDLTPGTYSATLWFTNLNDEAVFTRQFVLSILKAPVILTQPATQMLLGGATAIFAAAAGGGLPLFFQWQHDGTNLNDDARISGSQSIFSNAGNIYGSDSSVLTISNISPSDAGTYTLVASNVAGVATSSDALLVIPQSAPVIIQQPASQTAMAGTSAQFTVVALGDRPFAYQWQDDGTNLVDGAGISGSTSPTLTLSGISAADIGTYTVTISNVLGVVASSGAFLTVYVAPAGEQLVQNGGFETGSFSSWGESGNTIDCSVSSGAPGVHSGTYGALLGPGGSLGYLSQTLQTSPGGTYLVSLWLNSSDGLGPNEFEAVWNGEAVFDQTNIGALGWTNLQFQVMADSTNAVLQFGFRDDQSFLGLDDISVTPLLGADGAPVIAIEPAVSTVALAGGTASLSVFAAGQLPLSYQWFFDGTNIGGADSTLVLTNLTTNQTGAYTVVVSNSLGSTTSSNAMLTVISGNPVLATFDDLSGGGTDVPDPYDGLTWSNFNSINGFTANGPSGYNVGVVSPNNVIFDGFGTAAAVTSVTPFDLLSAFMTAAWNDGLRVEAKGYCESNLVYDNSYILSATAPTLITFDYVGVTTVEFSSSGGVLHPGYVGTGAHFMMDNVSLVFPPSAPSIITEPSNTLAIVGGSATFSVGGEGSTPLSYSWSRDGSAITGATASSYTLSNLHLMDSGSQFTCLVSNAYGTALSSAGILTVINPPGSSVLSQGNLVVTITNYGGRVSSLLFGGIELYRVGIVVSDWGLQTGTDGATFVRNEANTGTIGQPMTLVSSNNTSAFYSGVYNAGGADVAVGRSYVLVPGLDVMQVAQTFTNNGASSITLRCFDTYDPDWLRANVAYYFMAAQRYTNSTAAGPIQIGSGILTNDNTTVLFGSTDTAAVLAACITSYFGIQNSTNLNTFFLDNGTNSAGAVVDDALDIGREMTLAPGAGASFVYYQSYGTNSSAAQTNLANAVVGFPPALQSAVQSNSSLTLNWSAIPGQTYQVQYKTNLLQTNWVNFGLPSIASGTTILTTDFVSGDAQRFYRIVLEP
ncbi:MAG TPA: immunoglobulin domain-containing protein [Verrucomicrobiae bacterium]|jgi:hypothetical protein|nr:immunoglobulin domain-containing protein [Verrucomicrobiae bacterium]